MKKRKSKGYWDVLEHCHEVASQYQTRTELHDAEPGCYGAIMKHEWQDICFAHMGDYACLKWTDLEVCHMTALTCSSMKELHLKFPGCYNSILTHDGWKDICCSHIVRKRREYSKEVCREKALKYHSVYEFMRSEDGPYYDASVRNGWREIVCAGLPAGINRLPNGYWNSFEHCKTTALLCKDRTELQSKYSACMASIRKHHWEEECLGHMPLKYVVVTFELCKQTALKYETRSDFENGPDSNIYTDALNHGWLDEICQHMRHRGCQKRRCIYAATFSDGFAYVGLTYDAKERWDQHTLGKKGKTPVGRHAKQTGLIAKFEQLTEYLPLEEAKIQEDYFIKQYAADGWKMLNTARAGGLGGRSAMSKEEVIERVKKYERWVDFSRNEQGAWERAKKDGYLDEIKAMLKTVRYKTEEEYLAIARQYETPAEFYRHDKKAYNGAYARGILDKCCAHMKRKRK